MAYLHDEVLTKKGKEFIGILEEEGFEGKIAMLRDYFVKVSVKQGAREVGKVIIDYKARKNTFSIRTTEIKDERVKEKIESLWNKEQGFEIPGSAAFVDGSYIRDNVGYGAVIIMDNVPVKEISGYTVDPMFTCSRQVGGEILAVIEVVKWCMANGVEEITIFYDFANLEKWYDGTYSANTPMSRYYRHFLKKSPIKLNFVKVAAHTKVFYNEKADGLAKAGAMKKSMEELKGLAISFALCVEEKGYFAEFLDIYDNKYAKICIELEGETVGYLNIYNTEKLNMKPRFHEISDSNERAEIQRIWEKFQRGGRGNV